MNRRFATTAIAGRPNIGNRDRLLQRIDDMLDRRVLTNNGPYVQQFEESIAELLGVKHCVATCNATAALQLAVRALNLSGEVIVPSFTFIATAHALAWEGITPVFCDVGLNTHTLDAEQVQSLITDRTSAILGVHLWGRPCDIPALTQIAEKSKLRLFFDAAHALGCSFNGQMLGNFGDLEVLSFHATKVLNTFEGGALVTNDASLAAELRLARNFGFSGFDQVASLGINAKMCEISAAMGLTSLESLDRFCAEPIQLRALPRAPSGHPGYCLVPIRPVGTAQFSLYRARLPGRRSDAYPERTAGSPPAGKRAGTTVLLPWLPPDGTLPVDVSERRIPASKHPAPCRSTADFAERHHPWRGGYSGHFRRTATSPSECFDDPQCNSDARSSGTYGGMIAQCGYQRSCSARGAVEFMPIVTTGRTSSYFRPSTVRNEVVMHRSRLRPQFEGNREGSPES